MLMVVVCIEGGTVHGGFSSAAFRVASVCVLAQLQVLESCWMPGAIHSNKGGRP